MNADVIARGLSALDPDRSAIAAGRILLARLDDLARGLRNFFELYTPLATTWRFYDNSAPEGLRLLATGRRGVPDSIRDARLWARIRSIGGGSSMVEESAPTEDEFLRRELEVERVLRLAVREALLVHKKLGQSIAVWKGNRVVTLTAEEIPVDGDDDDRNREEPVSA